VVLPSIATPSINSQLIDGGRSAVMPRDQRRAAKRDDVGVLELPFTPDQVLHVVQVNAGQRWSPTG
jgi:hypothetical protein